MQNIKTPGVYIQEISKLPASVAPVATAIPAFVGYTKQRIRNREEIDENTPVQIKSLLEYEEIFGGAFDESFSITLESDPDDPEETVIKVGPEEADLSPYLMHHCLRLYFGNGGGKCWIVSVGEDDKGYDEEPVSGSIKLEDLKAGLKALEKEDEPTILVVPEAVRLNKVDRKSLHDAMLGQCEKLKDRFALFDVLVGDNKNSFVDAGEFRKEVGMEALKYGAAYYPSLNTTIRRAYNEKTILINDKRGENGIGEYEHYWLHELSTPVYKRGRIVIVNREKLSYGDEFTIGESTVTLVEDSEQDEDGKIEVNLEDSGDTAIEIAEKLANYFASKLSDQFEINQVSDKEVITIKSKEEGGDGDVVVISYKAEEGTVGATVLSEPTASIWARIKIVDRGKLSNEDEITIGGSTVKLDDIGVDLDDSGDSVIDIADKLANYFDSELSDEYEIVRILHEAVVIIRYKEEGADIASFNVLYEGQEGGIKISEPAASAWARIEIVNHEELSYGDKFTIGERTVTLVKENAQVNEIEVNLDDSGDSDKEIANKLVEFFGDLNVYEIIRVSDKAVIIIISKEEDSNGDLIKVLYEPYVVGAFISSENLELSEPDTMLYAEINKELAKKRLTLYPSAAMAGVYARVDRNRGVWKAPANVSLNLVSKPSLILTNEEQADLNVDANTGKSINAIRQFHGKGTIVWGARTLAGNDNEWRYIPVRRLFIFVEESIKKATEPVVFEANDANTWTKTRGMIENFLTDLWRDGALAGATPEEAFFVKAGLGQTMSANDILEGRLIIEIGLAAVRPAEFIILQFMHKLQES